MSKLNRIPEPAEVYELVVEFQRKAMAARRIAEAARLKADEHQRVADPTASSGYVREYDIACGSAVAYESAARSVAQLFGVVLPESIEPPSTPPTA